MKSIKTQTTKRTGLTEEKVLQKEKYRNILFLLYLSSVSIPMRQVNLIQKIVVPSKKPFKEEYTRNLFFEKLISTETNLGYINLENKFDSKYGLRRALTRLKKLELVISFKPKFTKSKGKKYSCLNLTDKGRCAWLKYTINKILDEIDDYEILLSISDYADVKSMKVRIIDWVLDEPPMIPVWNKFERKWDLIENNNYKK